MKQPNFTKQKTPPHPDESVDTLLTCGTPGTTKKRQFMLVTLQLYYEFKERFSRLGDLLTYWKALRWRFLKSLWKSYKNHIWKSCEDRKGLRCFILTLKEQQMEVLRKVPIVKNTDQLNDRAHVRDARRWSPWNKVVLETFVLWVKKLCA